jgi:hypothetical protein
MLAVCGLSGCASVRDYVSDTAWPFGNPNKPTAVSETANRALGQPVAVAPLTTEPGNVWPGTASPPPTIGDVERTMDQPLGQNYVPPLASPGADYAPPVPTGGGSDTGLSATAAASANATSGTEYTVPAGAKAKIVPPSQ